MKKFFVIFTIIFFGFLFTGCPLAWEDIDEDVIEIEGISVSVDSLGYTAGNIIRISLTGKPSIKNSNEKFSFDECEVSFKVLKNGHNLTGIEKFEGASRPEFDEWKYYDNEEKILITERITGKFSMKSDSFDEYVDITLASKGTYKIYADISFRKKNYYKNSCEVYSELFRVL